MASTARLDELKKKFDENPRRYFAPLANEHRKSGDLDQAIALCRTHLPQQPAHISGHIVLAQALFEAGSLDESREIFHTALGLDPENLIALRYLGDIARDAEDVATARSWYQRVLEVDPRNDEIVQLVRDLDAPRSVASADASADAPVAEAARVAEPAPTRAPVARPVEDDPRFAPLSLEDVDFDAAPDAQPATTEEGTAVSRAEQAPDASFDVHGSSSAASPTVGLPMLDAPELDPFDLPASASAESLFDGAGETPHDDIFMADLSGESSSELASQVEPEYAVADAWAAPAPSEAAPPAEPASTEPTSFEEGSFYLESAAVEPPALEVQAETTDATAADEALIAAATAETAAWELPEAPAAHEPVASADVMDAPEVVDAAAPIPVSAPDASVARAEPNEHAAVSAAEAPTAEWRAPDAHDTPAIDVSADDALGLEVMEFVPPSSEVAAPVESLISAEANPLLDRTPELTQAGDASQSATPAAFVTETMAELYLQQGFRTEALAVYRELLARNPTDSSLRDRIDQIESGSMSSIGIAAVSEDVVESAIRRQSAKPPRSVRSFFASLAGRRAPYQPPRELDDTAADVSSFAPVDESPVESEPTELLEPPSPASDLQPAADASSGEGRIAPLLSAAETLASFDPFADATDAASPMMEDAPDAMPNVEPPVLHIGPAASAAPPARDETPARRSLEDLFPDSPVTPRTEAAAQTLATAFGRPEPQGRPTRAASSELSLDKVFRGAPEGSPPADGGFSFDQFFSDARPAGGDVAAPTMSPPETGRSGGTGDAHDIEQFTAWLEGLKKK
jgi:hypothetical protein